MIRTPVAAQDDVLRAPSPRWGRGGASRPGSLRAGRCRRSCGRSLDEILAPLVRGLPRRRAYGRAAATERRDGTPGERWIDPRGPDGVTMLAPYEQYQPTEYPAVRGGDEARAGALFDLQNDPGEQRDVAAGNPDVVQRLKAAYDRMNANVPVVENANPKKAGKKKA